MRMVGQVWHTNIPNKDDVIRQVWTEGTPGNIGKKVKQ